MQGTARGDEGGRLNAPLAPLRRSQTDAAKVPGFPQLSDLINQLDDRASGQLCVELREEVLITIGELVAHTEPAIHQFALPTLANPNADDTKWALKRQHIFERLVRLFPSVPLTTGFARDAVQCFITDLVADLVAGFDSDRAPHQTTEVPDGVKALKVIASSDKIRNRLVVRSAAPPPPMHTCRPSRARRVCSARTRAPPAPPPTPLRALGVAARVRLPGQPPTFAC